MVRGKTEAAELDGSGVEDWLDSTSRDVDESEGSVVQASDHYAGDYELPQRKGLVFFVDDCDSHGRGCLVIESFRCVLGVEIGGIEPCLDHTPERLCGGDGL